MGQITTKIYQKACIYDFSVNGAFGNVVGVPGAVDLGISIIGGDSILSIRYTVLTPLVTSLGVALNVDAGWDWSGNNGMVNVADTIVLLNAGIGFWFTHIPAAPGYPKEAIGNTQDNNIGMKVAGGAIDSIIGGSMLFSFTLISHPL